MKYLPILLVAIFTCQIKDDVSLLEMKIKFINPQCDKIYLSSPIQLEANFKALYIGPKRNRIEVDLENSYNQREMIEHFNSAMNIQDVNVDFILGRYPIIAEKDYAKIIIDTSQEITTLFTVNESKTGLGKKEICVSHFPVIIENVYPSFFQVAYGDELDLTFEAINMIGNWESISHPPIRFCGTGLQAVSLSTNEIVISALPITKGEFQTKGRVKLGSAISNEIQISIDTTTFRLTND